MRTFKQPTKLILAFLLFATMALPAQADLIASYGHENDADRMQDDSGNGNTLTNNGGVTFVAAPSQVGEQFDLGDTVGQYRKNGGDDYLAVPDSVYTAGDDFSFAALIYKEDTTSLNTGHQTILASNRFRLQWRINRDTEAGTYDVGSQQLALGTRDIYGVTDPLEENTPMNGPAADSPSGTFMAGQWYFVALRYDQSENQLQAFIQSPSTTWDPTSITLTPTFAIDDFTNFRLGTDGVSNIGSGDGFDGYIDGARFYNTALSDAEFGDVLQDLYVVPEPSNLVLLVMAVAGLACASYGSRRRGR